MTILSGRGHIVVLKKKTRAGPKRWLNKRGVLEWLARSVKQIGKTTFIEHRVRTHI